MKTAIALVVVLAVNVGYLIGDFVGSRQSDTYRSNAMDLCAWHARSIYFKEDPSDESVARWHRVVNGQTVCPFCGQKHNDEWVSRNGWDSQVEAMMVEPKITAGRETKADQRRVHEYVREHGSAPPASWYQNGDPWRNLTSKEVIEANEPSRPYRFKEW